ncbi:MAG: 23S rRNA (adenine(2503)-C(2))-methyltransferase RlmN [Actinobacteria bacterium]|nr:23S rRNA (adenine(2503)-C(2))-methyltransferase RlmN [Actinomycetota bacterium]
MGAYELSFEDLVATLASWGEPAFRAKQVSAQLWRRAATYEEMSDLPPALRERLAAELPLEVEVLDERSADRGATRKALLKLGPKGHVIETVLMGYPDRVTVCVSSQAGCAMGCGFCATGQMGLQSNLTAGEIAAQVVWARREAARLPASTPRRLTNVVFMGMGEPLANERATFGAIERLTDAGGMRLGARHVTVSTVGLVPGIRRLADRLPQVGLAVSFHAADDELRDELVPINRVHPLGALVEAMDEHRSKTHRRPSIEWAMIDGTNDSKDQAVKLAAIARRLGAHVNLIPLNPTPGWPSKPSPPQRIRAFVRVLESARVNVTVRDTRGRAIDAACGQLRWEFDRATTG